MSRESTALSDFDFTTREHDTDAHVLSNSRYLSNETFVLREREEQPKKNAKRNDRKKKMLVESGNRISVLGTEVQQSHTAPIIATQAAFGHGPTLAMPTLLGMGQQMTRVESVDFSDVDVPLTMSGGSMGNNRQSRPLSNRQSRPLSNRQSRPLSDRQSRPLSDRQSRPLSDRQSHPLSDRQSRPLSDRQLASGPPILKIGQATVDGDNAQNKKKKGAKNLNNTNSINIVF